MSDSILLSVCPWLTNQQLKQFKQYAQFLREENEKMNLTAITEEDEVYVKHFYDCLLIESLIESNASLCDVGSGAGFPGIVLAIARPDLNITLLEPLTKRCHFLLKLIELLQLKNVSVINERAEMAHDLRESFDVVSARAVANLSILLELCVPLTKINGKLVLMKGSKGEEELSQASHAIKQLGISLDHVDQQTLLLKDHRVNLVFKKNRKTDKKFPRSFAKIKKSPL